MFLMDSNEHTFVKSEALAVFQLSMFWLKADAELNVCEPHR